MGKDKAGSRDQVKVGLVREPPKKPPPEPKKEEKPN